MNMSPGPEHRTERCASTALKERSTTKASRAFTRTELAVALACLALLVAIVLPTLATNGGAGDRAVCLNNLRLIGRAFQIWSKDHGQIVPWRVPVSQGGTQRASKTGAVWYEFAFVSNGLASAQILACPSDQQKRVARGFSSEAEGGFLNPACRDNALSYWVGLDVGYARGAVLGSESLPDDAVAGDRNLSVNGLGLGCSSGVNNAAQINSAPSTIVTTRWTNGLHSLSGNVLLNDGRVEQLSTPGLRRLLSREYDNGAFHLLIP